MGGSQFKQPARGLSQIRTIGLYTYHVGASHYTEMDFSIACTGLCNVKETKYIGVSEEVPDNMQTHPSAMERNRRLIGGVAAQDALAMAHPGP